MVSAKTYVVLLPFSANRQNILLTKDGRFISYELDNNKNSGENVRDMFKKATGIKTKYHHWELFCKLIIVDKSNTLCYKMVDNIIYDYKNTDTKLMILKVDDALFNQDTALLTNLAISSFDSADLIKF